VNRRFGNELARTPQDEFRLHDEELRVLRIACEYVRDSGLAPDKTLDHDVWSAMVSSYRKTLIAVWAAGRNGGWIEDTHLANLYYGGLLYLSRDLSRLPTFTIHDAQLLHDTTRKLGRMMEAKGAA
jgi:hypothetical protein